MEINKKDVGLRIRSIRKDRGMTLDDFGDLLNPQASDSIVSRWERGVSLPSNERTKQIAELGEISVEELLYGNYKNRIREILVESNVLEELDHVEFVANYFENTNHKYPAESEIIDTYNHLLKTVIRESEQIIGRNLLARNIDDLEILFYNIHNDYIKLKDKYQIKDSDDNKLRKKMIDRKSVV